MTHEEMREEMSRGPEGRYERYKIQQLLDEAKRAQDWMRQEDGNVSDQVWWENFKVTHLTVEVNPHDS